VSIVVLDPPEQTARFGDGFRLRVDVTEQGPRIPDGAVVPQAGYLVSEKQGYGLFQPNLLLLFLRPQALEFSFFRVPGVPQFLRPFLRLFPGTGLGAHTTIFA
jgi:hypothetical protein